MSDSSSDPPPSSPPTDPTPFDRPFYLSRSRPPHPRDIPLPSIEGSDPGVAPPPRPAPFLRPRTDAERAALAIRPPAQRLPEMPTPPSRPLRRNADPSDPRERIRSGFNFNLGLLPSGTRLLSGPPPPRPSAPVASAARAVPPAPPAPAALPRLPSAADFRIPGLLPTQEAVDAVILAVLVAADEENSGSPQVGPMVAAARAMAEQNDIVRRLRAAGRGAEADSLVERLVWFFRLDVIFQ
ncbi:hypothetical protein HYFRA_00012429 [Hymenoscyphus fraxineus]|uniref:Uncharacterized protein n=1 Tax=Hymenoscyphus fraxineus TaxID=746836 RepID=A0A9N9L4U5_9HELO|nr:hypothetical protein HYFRA_00012429 [Hymenoscyphus fraxineus]